MAVPACSQSGSALPPLNDPVVADGEWSRVTVKGRLRDAPAAVRRGLPIRNFAVLSESGGGTDGFLEYEIVGVRGEPGRVRLEFERTDGSLTAGRIERPITISVHLGRFGDAEGQRALASRIAREMLSLSRTERGVAITE